MDCICQDFSVIMELDWQIMELRRDRHDSGDCMSRKVWMPWRLMEQRLSES